MRQQGGTPGVGSILGCCSARLVGVRCLIACSSQATVLLAFRCSQQAIGCFLPPNELR
jgi:hypothetical protein